MTRLGGHVAGAIGENDTLLVVIVVTSRVERATDAIHSDNMRVTKVHFRELNIAVKCTLHIKHVLAKQINTTQTRSHRT